MREFYIIDTRTNEIVNCVSTDCLARAEQVKDSLIGSEHLRVTDRPSMAQLRRYRYWDERP